MFVIQPFIIIYMYCKFMSKPPAVSKVGILYMLTHKTNYYNAHSRP